MANSCDLSPAKTGCVWASTSPGITQRPAASTSFSNFQWEYWTSTSLSVLREAKKRCQSIPLMYRKITIRFNTEMSKNVSHLVPSAKLFPGGGKILPLLRSVAAPPTPLTQLLLCCLDRPRQRLVPISLPLWELPRHLEPRPWAPSRRSYTPGPAGALLGCAGVRPWLEDKSGWGLQLFARGCSSGCWRRACTHKP